MDFEQLEADLIDLPQDARARIVAGIAELAYEFPRRWISVSREPGMSNAHEVAVLGFFGRLIDVTAAEYLPLTTSPREFWETYGFSVVPFAAESALKSSHLTEDEAGALSQSLTAWIGRQQIESSELEQISLPIRFLFVIDDRWKYWEVQLLRRSAQSPAEVTPPKPNEVSAVKSLPNPPTARRRGRPPQQPHVHPEVFDLLADAGRINGEALPINAFWRLAGFTDDTIYGAWQRGDTGRVNNGQAAAFERILKLTPAEFLAKFKVLDAN